MSLVAQASEGDTTPVGRGGNYKNAGRHGIDTAGKRTPDGIREWTLNDAIADIVQRVLEENNIETIRIDDETGMRDISLIDRTNCINNIQPDLHLSIHHNALTDGQWGEWTGTEAFVKTPQSRANNLAQNIVNSISNTTGLNNRGVKYDSLHMTREVNVPSVLVEVGFMDSTIDYNVITNTQQQEEIGKTIAKRSIKLVKLWFVKNKKSLIKVDFKSKRYYNIYVNTINVTKGVDTMKKTTNKKIQKGLEEVLMLLNAKFLVQ